MLSNAYFLAKFRFDTAEHVPAKNLQDFSRLSIQAEYKFCPQAASDPRPDPRPAWRAASRTSGATAAPPKGEAISG